MPESTGQDRPNATPMGQVPARVPWAPLVKLDDIQHGMRVEARKRTETAELAMYQVPKHIVWAQEALGKLTGVSKDVAATFAISVGLRWLKHLPGIERLVEIRRQVVSRGDPESMGLFEHHGTVDFDTGGAGVHGARYRRSLDRDLVEVLGRFASDIGVSGSQLGILALMAAHFDSQKFARREYRVAMKNTLTRFGKTIQRRVALAEQLVLQLGPVVAADAGPETGSFQAFIAELSADSDEAPS